MFSPYTEAEEEKIKKVNKRVELKHTSLNRTKSLLLTGVILERSRPEKQGKTFTLTLAQQERWGIFFVLFWGLFGGVGSGGWAGICHCTRGSRKHLNECPSTEQKMHEVSPAAIVRRYFSKQAFLLRGQEAANQMCILLWKNSERESFPEVLSTHLWPAALKLSQ